MPNKLAPHTRFVKVAAKVFDEWKALKIELETDLRQYAQSGNITGSKETRRYLEIVNELMNDLLYNRMK